MFLLCSNSRKPSGGIPDGGVGSGGPLRLGVCIGPRGSSIYVPGTTTRDGYGLSKMPRWSAERRAPYVIGRGTPRLGVPACSVIARQGAASRTGASRRFHLLLSQPCVLARAAEHACPALRRSVRSAT